MLSSEKYNIFLLLLPGSIRVFSTILCWKYCFTYGDLFCVYKCSERAKEDESKKKEKLLFVMWSPWGDECVETLSRYMALHTQKHTFFFFHTWIYRTNLCYWLVYNIIDLSKRKKSKCKKTKQVQGTQLKDRQAKKIHTR